MEKEKEDAIEAFTKTFEQITNTILGMQYTVSKCADLIDRVVSVSARQQDEIDHLQEDIRSIKENISFLEREAH